MVHDLIERDCPEAVAWCVAYGRFTELLKQDGKKRPLPRNGSEFLTVTPLSLGEAQDVLSEKVFGPLLYESLQYPYQEVWTLDRYKAEARAESTVWQSVTNVGITLFGQPIKIDARLKSTVS
jgi:hypothetical protein